MLLILSGCMESELEKKQKEHLNQYYQNISNIMNGYVKSASSSTKIEDVHKAHLKVLENLNKVKMHFSQFNDEEKLQTIVSLYDSALNHLIVRQIQILELGQPVWVSSLEKLENIKDADYYQQHQGILSELISMLEEYKTLILEHHEHIRKKMVASTLTKEEREQVWPSLNGQITSYLYTIKPKLKSLKNRVDAEIEIVKFLHENKSDYVVNEEHGLQFNTPWILNAYQTKISLLERKMQLLNAQ